MRIKYIYLLLVICSANLLSQGMNPAAAGGLRAGLNAALNINYHTSDFKALPGVPNCCPEFTSGFGFGYNIGGILEYRITETFAAQLRVNSVSHDVLLSNIESELLSLNGEPISGEFEHRLDISLSSYGIDLLGDYRIAPALSIIGGGRFGIISTHTAGQVEEIIKPENKGVFVDTGERTRNKYSGEIPDASPMIISLLGGIRYEMPLNKSASAVLAPELIFSFGLSPVIKNYSWSAHSIRLGAAILFDIGGHAPAIDKEPTPTIEIEPAMTELVNTDKTADSDMPFEIAIRAVGVDNGTEQPQLLLTIEQFLSAKMHPMLNYVFFDENSFAIPDRYEILSKEKADGFRLDSLNISTLNNYYNLLNIIGLRMRNNPEAKIIISGFNSDNNGEQGNIALSEGRAKSVAGYLNGIWGIPLDRMEIQAGGLPPNPSPSDEQDGNEENRRVEITSPNYNITAPVVTNDTLRIASPQAIRFYSDIASDNEIKSWKISATQNGKLLKAIDGQGSPPDIIDWEIGREKKTIPGSSEVVVYIFEITDSEGNTGISEPGYFPVRQKTIRHKKEENFNDNRIDSYSLISFEFDKYRLGRQNSKIVSFIKDNISDNSEVVVTGYTDRLGEADYNLQLSERRAAEVARQLGIPRSKAFGSGENTEIYDNTLPEGRFFSRSVEVKVITPLKWK